MKHGDWRAYNGSGLIRSAGSFAEGGDYVTHLYG
jgi:hypothetical protein